MKNKEENIDIRDAVVLFGCNKQDMMMGVVTYQGDLHNNVPKEIHLDTARGFMEVVFENGTHKKICDLDESNTKVANNIYDELKRCRKSLFNKAATSEPVRCGFYQVDEKHNLKNPCYRVDVLVI